LMQFNAHNVDSIQRILDNIKLYQLKSNFFDCFEKIIHGFIKVGHIDLGLYILEQLGNTTNSPLYSQRFLPRVFDLLVHSPLIDLGLCTRFVQIYISVETTPKGLDECLFLDNYNMLTAIVELMLSSPQLSPQFIIDKDYYLTLAVSYGSLDCLEYLLSLDQVYNVEPSIEEEYQNNLIILPKAINGLRFIKKREQVLEILSRYDPSQISILLHSLYTPSVDVYEPQQQIHSGASPVLVQSSLDPDTTNTQINIISSSSSPSSMTMKIPCQECKLLIHPDDIEDHRFVCSEALYPCPNSIHCCTEKPMKKHQLLNHLQTQCLYLHCHQCDSMFSRSDFTQHLFSHEYHTWETCTLCSQMLPAFNTSYKDEIIHIKTSQQHHHPHQHHHHHHHHNPNNNNNKHNNNTYYSSEYKHLLTCKNHFVKCPSCRISFHITEAKDHHCPFINKLPVYRNINFQNNDLVNLF